MTVNRYKFRPGSHEVRVTRADVEVSGGIRDMPSYAELQAEHLRARARGDWRRAGLLRESLVRRIIEAQRQNRQNRSAA